MKKAITILAVLIVLVSAVFAAETHTLKIKATQDDIYPAFQMYVKAVTSGTKDSAVITNSGAVVYDKENAAPNEAYETYVAPVEANPEAQPPVEAAAESGVAATFSFETANTVTVAVYIANAAKTARDFSLTFTGGKFSTVTSNGTPVAAVTATVTTANGAGSSVDGADGFETSAGGSDNIRLVDFSGQTCTEDAEVATANYAYVAHPEIDPGTYYADIILTIATTN